MNDAAAALSWLSVGELGDIWFVWVRGEGGLRFESSLNLVQAHLYPPRIAPVPVLVCAS